MFRIFEPQCWDILLPCVASGAFLYSASLCYVSDDDYALKCMRCYLSDAEKKRQKIVSPNGELQMQMIFTTYLKNFNL